MNIRRIKSILGIIVASIIIIVCLLVIQLSNNQSNDDENKNDLLDTNRTLYDIPVGLFEGTSDREFNISLKSLESGESWNINESTIFTDIDYKFNVSQIPAGDENGPLVPGEMMAEARFGKDVMNDVFVFGVVNNTKKKQYFEKNRLVYISYRGNPEWELCGINTSMTKEQVIEVLGNPTQQYNSDDGYSMEWYVLKDEHAYIIGVILNSDNNSVWKISLNVDNHPVFAR